MADPGLCTREAHLRTFSTGQVRQNDVTTAIGFPVDPACTNLHSVFSPLEINIGSYSKRGHVRH